MEYINLAFRNGGPFMYVILATLIFGIAIIVERFTFIAIKNRIDTTTFVNRVIELINGGRIPNAIGLCNGSNAALPAMSEIPKLEKRTHYLSMIANVATLLGLLGTIVGLIQSFQSVAAADSSQKAALLSAGISVAMNTTAFGLMVAIPCMVFHSYIQSRTNALIDEINENVMRIYQKMIKAPRG